MFCGCRVINRRFARPWTHDCAFCIASRLYLRIRHPTLSQLTRDQKSAARLKLLECDVEVARNAGEEENGPAAGVAQPFGLKPAGNGFLNRFFEGRSAVNAAAQNLDRILHQPWVTAEHPFFLAALLLGLRWGIFHIGPTGQLKQVPSPGKGEQ